MTDLTALRQAIVTHLTTVLTEADVIGGVRTGVNRNQKPLVCVFWPGIEVRNPDVSLQTPTLTVRYFPVRAKTQPVKEPADPAPVENAGKRLLEAFPRSTQEGSYFVPNVSVVLRKVVPDYRPEEWMAEATLTGWAFTEAA